MLSYFLYSYVDYTVVDGVVFFVAQRIILVELHLVHVLQYIYCTRIRNVNTDKHFELYCTGWFEYMYLRYAVTMPCTACRTVFGLMSDDRVRPCFPFQHFRYTVHLYSFILEMLRLETSLSQSPL